LKLFCGEEAALPSKGEFESDAVGDTVTPYVRLPCHWTPEFYYIIGPLYKDTISENGLG
jgi:hypothetical protein